MVKKSLMICSNFCQNKPTISNEFQNFIYTILDRARKDGVGEVIVLLNNPNDPVIVAVLEALTMSLLSVSVVFTVPEVSSVDTLLIFSYELPTMEGKFNRVIWADVTGLKLIKVLN